MEDGVPCGTRTPVDRLQGHWRRDTEKTEKMRDASPGQAHRHGSNFIPWFFTHTSTRLTRKPEQPSWHGKSHLPPGQQEGAPDGRKNARSGHRRCPGVCNVVPAHYRLKAATRPREGEGQARQRFTSQEDEAPDRLSVPTPVGHCPPPPAGEVPDITPGETRELATDWI